MKLEKQNINVKKYNNIEIEKDIKEFEYIKL